MGVEAAEGLTGLGRDPGVRVELHHGLHAAARETRRVATAGNHVQGAPTTKEQMSKSSDLSTYFLSVLTFNLSDWGAQLLGRAARKVTGSHGLNVVEHSIRETEF